MHKTQIYLTDQQTLNIKKYAEEKGIRMSEMIRRIIDSFFDGKEENESTKICKN